jgi:hypothetical protein
MFSDKSIDEVGKKEIYVSSFKKKNENVCVLLKDNERRRQKGLQIDII